MHAVPVSSRLQDDFYLRHLIKNNLLDPVMDAFFANGDRYNLLNSAVLEMVEFIRKENLKVSEGTADDGCESRGQGDTADGCECFELGMGASAGQQLRHTVST
jgi:hypothetical protein